MASALQTDTELDDVLVSGFVRQNTENSTILIPMDMVWLISLFSEGNDGSLIVEENEHKVLNTVQQQQYEFTNVIIKSNGTLTITDRDSRKRKGGRLIVKTLRFVIAPNGKLDLSGKGHKGGIHTNQCRDSYGIQSEDDIDEELVVGSGGSSHTDYFPGGNGGGALHIKCARFENYGQICCNGTDAVHSSCFGGSGGTILIECQRFLMKKGDEHNFIHARGGLNRFQEMYSGIGGTGGIGYIRIAAANAHSVPSFVDSAQIVPRPFIE